MSNEGMHAKDLFEFVYGAFQNTFPLTFYFWDLKSLFILSVNEKNVCRFMFIFCFVLCNFQEIFLVNVAKCLLGK